MRLDTLSKEAIIKINEGIPFKQAEGLSGSGDANLDFAVYRTSRTRGVNRKAAVLMQSLIQAHAFVDGNKRTGFVAAKTLLEANGKTWDVVHEYTKEEFTKKVVNNEITINQMAQWFANHTKKVKK